MGEIRLAHSHCRRAENACAVGLNRWPRGHRRLSGSLHWYLYFSSSHVPSEYRRRHPQLACTVALLTSVSNHVCCTASGQGEQVVQEKAAVRAPLYERFPSHRCGCAWKPWSECLGFSRRTLAACAVCAGLLRVLLCCSRRRDAGGDEDELRRQRRAEAEAERERQRRIAEAQRQREEEERRRREAAALRQYASCVACGRCSKMTAMGVLLRPCFAGNKLLATTTTTTTMDRTSLRTTRMTSMTSRNRQSQLAVVPPDLRPTRRSLMPYAVRTSKPRSTERRQLARPRCAMDMAPLPPSPQFTCVCFRARLAEEEAIDVWRWRQERIQAELGVLASSERLPLKVIRWPWCEAYTVSQGRIEGIWPGKTSERPEEACDSVRGCV